ncbi:acyltransferase family protein [Kribbella sp. NPDC050124]|uniref:acyltransferase family protein n=1 Tax=Kribbella sp. NPDC050124 TaxID=3364114 RepID=UPI00379EFB55
MRCRYLDNLKVVVIAVIIALHAVLSYAGGFDVWWYTEVREVSLAPVTEIVLFLVVGPFGLLMIPLLFLVAGLVAVPSLERKGAKAYAGSRLLRLGLPFAVYVALLQPPVVYALEHRFGVAKRSYLKEFLGEPAQLDMGPLWFVGVLLLFSLGYAAWAAVRRPRPRAREVTLIHLLVLAAVVAPATYGLRLLFRIGDEGLVSGLNFWEWPVCAAMFGLGIAASEQGWLQAVPQQLVRRCRTVTLTAAGVLVAVMAAGVAAGLVDDEVWRGGANWVALVFATLTSPLTVFGPVWLLGLAQRHLDRRLPWVGPVVTRSAYGAFIVQAVVLIGLAVLLRPVPAAAEVKAVLLAGGGIWASFALARLLINWVPGVGRVV